MTENIENEFPTPPDDDYHIEIRPKVPPFARQKRFFQLGMFVIFLFLSVIVMTIEYFWRTV